MKEVLEKEGKLKEKENISNKINDLNEILIEDESRKTEKKSEPKQNPSTNFNNTAFNNPSFNNIDPSTINQAKEQIKYMVINI